MTETVIPPSNPVVNMMMNSLQSTDKVISTIPITADTPKEIQEPMDCCGLTPGGSPNHISSQKLDIEGTESMMVESPVLNINPSESNSMQIESEIHSSASSGSVVDSDCDSKTEGDMVIETESESKSTAEDLTIDDLVLLADLFYLPFEHGSQGVNILQEFQWLKLNSQYSTKPRNGGESPEVSMDLYNLTRKDILTG